MCAPFSEENGNSKDMNQLDKYGMKKCDPDFQNDTVTLFERVYNGTPVKEMNSRPIRGAVLADLFEQYVQHLNKGGVPNVSSAWDSYIQKQIGELTALARDTIDNRIQESISGGLPVGALDLAHFFDEIKTEALDLFSEVILMAQTK